MIPRVSLTRLEKDVKKIEQRPVRTGGLIFFGDSHFTRWTPEFGNEPLETVLSGIDGIPFVLNHGIGGATAEELLFYYPRLVRPYAPSGLVLSAYGNDTMFAYSATEVLALQSRILEYARTEFPGIKLYICDPKVDSKHIGTDESLWRWQYGRDEYIRLLGRYAEEHPDTKIIYSVNSEEFFASPEDVGDYNKARKDLFIEDAIHFNRAGYDACARFYRVFFAKEFEED